MAYDSSSKNENIWIYWIFLLAVLRNLILNWQKVKAKISSKDCLIDGFMISKYFPLLCTSQCLPFRHIQARISMNTHVSRTCSDHACACMRVGNIFDAACPDVSKLSLYIDYRAVVDREESRLSSGMHKSLI